MAYDMTMDYGTVGDQFFRELQPIASRIPFQAVPGNHECDDHFCDFLSYRARLFNQNLTGTGMPHFSGQSRYYSFEIPGLLHVAAIDTDAYALPDYTSSGNGGSGQSFFVGEQWEWLRKDLAAVDRKKTPWVFLMGHHPMYCSSSGEVMSKDAQTEEDVIITEGQNGEKLQAFPKLACSAANVTGRQEAWHKARAEYHKPGGLSLTQ